MHTGLVRRRVAIVTGAGEGIGLAVAAGLASAGDAVVVNDIDAERTRAAVRRIRDAGGECRGFPGDAGDREVAAGMVAAAVEDYGRLDVLAANAGVTLFRPFLETRPEDVAELLRVNVAGSFFLAQAAARQMLDSGGGAVLFTSSVTGRRGHPNLAAYAMTKAALEGLARSLAVELAPRIRVNALVPGATSTPRNLAEDADYDDTWARRAPLARVGQPEDQAAAALFLLSDAARHITGQALVVDGGWSVLGSMQEVDR